MILNWLSKQTLIMTGMELYHQGDCKTVQILQALKNHLQRLPFRTCYFFISCFITQCPYLFIALFHILICLTSRTQINQVLTGPVVPFLNGFCTSCFRNVLWWHSFKNLLFLHISITQSRCLFHIFYRTFSYTYFPSLKDRN